MNYALNEILYVKAKSAVMDLYNDQSVDVSVALVNLNTLRDELDLLIDALKADSHA